MKIIDLLVKMSKGEKIKPFEIYGEKYYVNEEGYINDRDGNVNWLIYDEWLNQEVEIIEEEKEIEKLNLDTDELLKNVVITAQDYVIEGKINELIDVINDMRDKE